MRWSFNGALDGGCVSIYSEYVTSMTHGMEPNPTLARSLGFDVNDAA